MDIASIISVVDGMLTVTKNVIITDKAARATIDDLQTKTLLLRDQIFSIQSERESFLHTISDLKHKIADLEKTIEDKDIYESIEPYEGTFVYIDKRLKNTPDKQRWYCAKCMDEFNLPITLQGTKSTYGYCPKCQTPYQFKEDETPIATW